MGFNEIGSQSTDTPKTPTLRQWCKQNPDSEIHCSQVKVVFKPTAYASYTFVSEHDFKVVVEKGSTLANYLHNSLSDALHDGVCLYIQIKDRDKGSWAVSALEGNETDWQEFTWGYKAGTTRLAAPPQKKPARRGTTSGTEE